MSIEAMAICLHHSRARGTAKVILWGIANHDNDERGAYPSLATLCRYSNVNERAARNALRELEELGEIRTLVNEGPAMRGGKTNRYEILLSCPVNCDGTKAHRLLSDDELEARIASVRPPAVQRRGSFDPRQSGARPPAVSCTDPRQSAAAKPREEPRENRGARARVDVSPPSGQLPPRFCGDHPAGTATPCRACGAAGRDHDLAVQRQAEARERQRHADLVADDLAARRAAAPPPIDRLRAAVRKSTSRRGQVQDAREAS